MANLLPFTRDDQVLLYQWLLKFQLSQYYHDLLDQEMSIHDIANLSLEDIINMHIANEEESKKICESLKMFQYHYFGLENSPEMDTSIPNTSIESLTNIPINLESSVENEANPKQIETENRSTIPLMDLLHPPLPISNIDFTSSGDTTSLNDYYNVPSTINFPSTEANRSTSNDFYSNLSPNSMDIQQTIANPNLPFQSYSNAHFTAQDVDGFHQPFFDSFTSLEESEITNQLLANLGNSMENYSGTPLINRQIIPTPNYSIKDFQSYVDCQKEKIEIMGLHITHLPAIINFKSEADHHTASHNIFRNKRSRYDDEKYMSNDMWIKKKRSGRWSTEEEQYAKYLIKEFEDGLLPLSSGTMLRMFLATILNCERMRVSKKFAGRGPQKKATESMGIHVFQKNTEAIEQLSDHDVYQKQQDLMELEKIFFLKVNETENLYGKCGSDMNDVELNKIPTPIYMGWQTYDPRTNPTISVFGENRSEKGGRKPKMRKLDDSI